MNIKDYKKLYLELQEENTKLKLELEKKDKILHLIEEKFENQLDSINQNINYYGFRDTDEAFDFCNKLFKEIKRIIEKNK